MQFGIFTVGDVTTDPTTGRTPTEHERIKATVAIAKKAEEVGLDVFADRRAPQPAVRRRRRRRPRWPTSPPRPSGILLSTATTLITTTDPVRIAEDYAHAAAPVRRPRRPDDGPRQHRPGLPVVRQGHPRRHRAGRRELRAAAPAVARGRRRLGGQVPHAAAGLHLDPAPARRRRRRSCGTARSAAPRSPSRPRTTATASSPTTSSGPPRTPSRWSTLYRRRFEHYGHGTADQAIVGLGGQVFMRKNSQDAVREFRPYFDNAPVYGHGPSLEEFTERRRR